MEQYKIPGLVVLVLLVMFKCGSRLKAHRVEQPTCAQLSAEPTGAFGALGQQVNQKNCK